MKRGYLFALVVLFSTINSGESLQADDVVIENHGEQTFYYALRDADGATWSSTYEIAPGEKNTHVTSQRLRISYLTSAAQFEWLEPQKVYRIDNVAQGPLRTVTVVRRPSTPSASPDVASSAPTTGEAAELPAPSADTASNATASSATASKEAAADKDAAADLAGESSASASGEPARTPADNAATSAPAVNAGRGEEPFDGLLDITNRVVTVRAIADTTYRNAFPEWRQRMRRIVEGASDYYRREYAIRLVLTETTAWEYEGVSDDLDARWARLLEQSPHEADLIVALVGYGDYSSVKGEAALTGQLGRAAFFGQHLMVADRKDYHENRAKTVLIHELGHVFGAFHVADQKLMMYPGYLQLPTDAIIAGTVPFGETIDEVLTMTKEFDFRQGVASLSPTTQHRIQLLYHQHGLQQESRQTDPVTEGYKYLERRAKIVAAQMAKRAEAARGAFDGLTQ